MSAITRPRLRAQAAERVAGHLAVVEGGDGAVRRSCPCSCPLPAITTTSPSERPDARDRRGAVGLDLGAPVGAGEDLVDDLAGSSLRGLSEVTTHVVGEPRAASPHERPLAPVAVAAAAEDQPDPALGERPCLAQDVLERVRCVGVVDEHGERLRLVHRLEAAGDARRRARRRARWPRPSIPTSRASRDGAQDVLDVEAAAQPRVGSATPAAW